MVRKMHCLALALALSLAAGSVVTFGPRLSLLFDPVKEGVKEGVKQGVTDGVKQVVTDGVKKVAAKGEEVAKKAHFGPSICVRGLARPPSLAGSVPPCSRFFIQFP